MLEGKIGLTASNGLKNKIIEQVGLRKWPPRISSDLLDNMG